MEEGGNNAQEARLSIRVGNAKIDLRGTEQVVTAQILKLRAHENSGLALSRRFVTEERWRLKPREAQERVGCRNEVLLSNL